jgi:hypothetical protein
MQVCHGRTEREESKDSHKNSPVHVVPQTHAHVEGITQRSLNAHMVIIIAMQQITRWSTMEYNNRVIVSGVG